MIYQHAIVVATSVISANEGIPLVTFGFCQKSCKVYKMHICINPCKVIFNSLLANLKLLYPFRKHFRFSFLKKSVISEPFALLLYWWIKSYFFAPNFEEVQGHIGLGLAIYPSFCPSVNTFRWQLIQSHWSGLFLIRLECYVGKGILKKLKLWWSVSYLFAMTTESPHRLIVGKWLNCIFSITSEVMWTIFDSYDHLMIVYPVYVFMTSDHFVRLPWKKNILNGNSSKTTEVVWF